VRGEDWQPVSQWEYWGAVEQAFGGLELLLRLIPI
jgi:hypothetical protein